MFIFDALLVRELSRFVNGVREVLAAFLRTELKRVYIWQSIFTVVLLKLLAEFDLFSF